MNDCCKIRRALVSVSDKSGVVELARELDSLGIEIISTGGTLKKLRENNIHVVSVPSFTGSPEVMDGRVKTLHPKIHGALLYRRGNEKDIEALAELESKSIDLVIVNLYPFKETVAKKDVSHDEIIENIDIGGPSMLRSAAKNYSAVTVVTDPADYQELLKQLKENNCGTSSEFRIKCASKVFALTSDYERAISNYFQSVDDPVDNAEKLPDTITHKMERQSSLRYGENPHQEAAVYRSSGNNTISLLDGEVLSGKELSYNNYNDLDTCLEMLLDFDKPFACLLKHANPCGAATSGNLAEAYKRAYASDPLSAFGCIIGLNREVDLEVAKELHETHFVECILAPSYTDDAFKLLKKKKNRRIMALPGILQGRGDNEVSLRHIRGGMLAQTSDDHIMLASDLKIVTKRKPTEVEISDLLFAWKVVKHTKSNAIVLAKECATVGIGMGQTSRVDAAFIAVKRAGDRASGAVVASDAFYPMPDGLEVASDAGAVAFIQPGGSKGDDAVIEAADKANVSMVFTGVRHFKH